MTIALFVVGIPTLIIGAELLVRGASRIASASGIPPLIVGLTVVALATSSPEMAVSIDAALKADGDIAIGNLVGSNTFNILFILGLSALITPLAVSQQLVRLDIPLIIIASVVTLLLALDRTISRLDGFILFTGMIVYIIYLIWNTRRSRRPAKDLDPKDQQRTIGYPKNMLFTDVASIAFGVVLLVVGAEWLVDGAVDIADVLGVSKLVISLTIISAGTALPEIATSVIASVRGVRDIAVGNVVGSNLFNLLAVLGITGILAPGGVDVANSLITFDLPVMTAVAIASLLVFFTGYEISRWEGWFFLGYYHAYVAYLILRATEHDLLPAFSSIMLLFVVPITVLTLVLLTAKAIHNRKSQL